MGTHIQDFATFSSKLKEMKSVKEEQEKSTKQEEYAQFFKKTLQKYGVSSPAELKNDTEKKAFFDEIDKGWEPDKGLTSSGEETMSESFKIDKKSNPNYNWEFEVKSFNDPKIAKILNDGGYKKLSGAGVEFGTDPQGMLVMGDTEAEKKKAIELLNSLGIYENFEIHESEINSDQEFREYAETVLKNMHGEEYDQTKADDVINDLLSKKEGDDFGALIGMLNKGN